MFRKLYLSLFFFLSLTLAKDAKAQWGLDLKTDAISWAQSNPNFLVEFTPGNRFGFEIGGLYSSNVISFSTIFETNNVVQLSDNFNRDKLQFFASVKYYVFKQQQDRGWYSGFSSALEMTTYLDPNYELLYQEIFQRNSDLDKTKELFTGIPIGYKWVLKDRLVIDPFVAAGRQWNYWFSNWHSVWKVIYQIRVGYRFSAKK